MKLIKLSKTLCASWMVNNTVYFDYDLEKVCTVLFAIRNIKLKLFRRLSDEVIVIKLESIL